MRKKLAELSEMLDKKIQKAQEFAKKTKHSANEVAKTAAGSWSAAGDREHSRGQAEITEENLKKLEAIEKEIEIFLDKEPPLRVEPVSFVTIRFQDRVVNEFYFMKTPFFSFRS